VVAVNKFDAVRMGMTALPNAAADAAGGLPISDAGGLDLDAQVGTKINDILTDTGTTLDGRLPAALVSGRIDASVGAMAADVMTAAAAAADLTTELQSGLALQTSVDTLEASVAAIEADTQDIQARIPAALIGGRIDATVDATGMESGAIDAILDDTIGDGTLTMRQALRVLVAGMAGKLSGAATTTVTIRNTADSANVIVATCDADGNRSAVTVTP
jgi:predicted regulator of Ras-like GTPase activity (Roadblock/LC7/MglB family)